MRLVFVSSTFKDMQFERDALKVRVAPRIDSFLTKYGENVHFGDLRWGVNTSELESEESSKKVLKVCLDEIDDCRPYMIVFIGERYGWIPSSELLEETMAMKGITDVPSDISVTNLEIEYGALINPDYEGRILFYFRNPIDTSEMSEEERKIYEAESPLHKEKLDNLKKLIEEKYPNYIRHYDVKYDKASKSLVGLEPLMDQISEDLKRIFDLDLSKLNSLPHQERAVQNAHAFFEKYYKHAYMRENATLHEWDLDYEDEIDADADHLPLVEMITGKEGSGRKTLLALKYKQSIEIENELTIPFVFNLDEFTDNADKFFSTLIYKIEEFAHRRITNCTTVEYLSMLIKEIEEDDPFRINVFVANADYEILTAIKLLEAYQPTWYIINFYLEDDDYGEESRDLPQFKCNFYTEVKPLEDEEKIQIINAIAKSRHKEISSQVIQKIIKKEASDNPLYLSLIVERLLMLDHEDFQNIRHLGDGMEAINKYMSSIVDNAGFNLKGIAKDLLKEIIERTNPKMALKLVAINTLSNHMNKFALEQLFKFYDWPFNDLDYSLFRRLVPSLFSISSSDNDSIWFKNDDITQAAIELIEDYHESNHLDDIIAWIENARIDETITESFIHRCKAIFYREKGDVNKFVDSFIAIIDEETGNSFADLSSDYLKRVSKYSRYYLSQLRKSYKENDGFYELVDDEIVARVTFNQVKNHIVLLNLYYTYYNDERHSTKELINLIEHHFSLTYKFLEKYREEGSLALRDFANFYSFLASGMDFGSIEMMEDEEAIENGLAVLKFIRADKVTQYVQQMKNERKIKAQLIGNTVIDSYMSAYKMSKEYDDEMMKRQFLFAVDAFEKQICASPDHGSMFKTVLSGGQVEIQNKDKPFFGGLPQLMFYGAMLYLEIDRRKADDYYQKGCYSLLCLLNNLTLEDIKNESTCGGLSEAVSTLMEYKKETECEIDDELADAINLKIKLYHALHPSDLRMGIIGVRFGIEGKINEDSFDTFKFFFPETYRGLLDSPKISQDDLLAMIVALTNYKDEYMYSDQTDEFARSLIVDAYDKNSTDEGLEMVFDMVYYYVDDLARDGLKDEFFMSVIDEIAGLFEDVEDAKDTLISEAKQYLRSL